MENKKTFKFEVPSEVDDQKVREALIKNFPMSTGIQKIQQGSKNEIEESATEYGVLLD